MSLVCTDLCVLTCMSDLCVLGRRGDIHDEGLLTPVKKRRTRADD